MTTFPDLARLAETLDVTLIRHDGGVPGFYDHTTRTISTRRGMSPTMYRSTLAHELAHATYNDTPTTNGHFSQRQERRADRLAAKLLIDPDTFDDDLAWCQGRLSELSAELEITQHLLQVYLEHHPASTHQPRDAGLTA